MVIATIAILAALLLPTLSQAKRRAKRTICLNNLKQFALADTMYLNDHQRLPLVNEFVPSSSTLDRLTTMAQYLGVTVPPGPLSTWPKRAEQPRWINCPMATESGVAEGVTLGAGVYTGYIYVGGIEDSKLISSGFATVMNPGQAADRIASKRGVLWADILDEFDSADPRRYEFFHRRKPVKYSDFRFHVEELDGIHRAWSDASVEWTKGSRLNLSGDGSPDLRLKHIMGNYYF